MPDQTPAPRMTVGGLNMSVATWQRTVAAMRGLYPTQTVGLSDFAAIQVVLAKIMTDWVSTWESQTSTPPIQQVVDQATQAALAIQNAAFAQAHADLSADVQPTITT